MALSLYAVLTQVAGLSPVLRNVLAEPDSQGNTSLQVAVAAALEAAGPGASFLNASQLGGKDIDVSIITGTPSDPRTVFAVQFRPSTGPNGTNLDPLLVYVNAPTGVSPQGQALRIAAQTTGGTPMSVNAIGRVDLDATAGAATALPSLTRAQFRALFTFAELLVIDAFENAAALTTVQKSTVRTFRTNLAAAESITLSDASTRAAVNYIASIGMITAERAAAILAGQPPA